jgi:hypothetical protein
MSSLLNPSPSPPVSRDEVVERLRSTPDRLEAVLSSASRRILQCRPKGKWSIQEHAGHLLDIEDLHRLRLAELDRGVEELHPADLSNRRTYEANHHDEPIGEILADFRFAREALLERFAGVDPAKRSVHPRLGQPIGASDLMLYAAEHDDHHLAVIENLIDRWRKQPHAE